MNQSNGLEDVALNVDTNKTQNLELLLGAADFAKFIAMETLSNRPMSMSCTKMKLDQ